MENLVLIGILLILVGIFLIIISSLKQAKVEYSVVGFIGPIPFGIASSKQMLIAGLILSLMIILILVGLRA